MKAKVTKGMAFLISMAIVFVMFASTSAAAVVSWFSLAEQYHRTELLLPFIGTFLTSVFSITAAFFGFNVTDNGIKGKFFNEGLSEAKKEQ